MESFEGVKLEKVAYFQHHIPKLHLPDLIWS